MLNRLTKESRHAILWMFLLSILGVCSLVVATRRGIGASPDSVIYIGGARSLASGQGYRSPSWDGLGEPITHFPPFYPMILALGDLLGIDPLLGARILNLILYGANILVWGCVLSRYGNEPRWMPVLGTFIVLTSVPMLSVHSMAWSEPSFLLLGFLSLLLLSRQLRTQSILLLVTSGLLAGFALLTRYAGIAFIVAGFCAFLLVGYGSYRKRLANGLIFSFAGILPGLIWGARNQWVAGTATNREIIYHPISLAKLLDGAKTLAGWLLIPGSLSPSVLTIIVLILVSCCSFVVYLIILRVEGWKSLSPVELWQHIPVFYQLLGIFILVYCGFLVASISLIDANTPLDDRILSPIFWGGSILVFSFLGRLAVVGYRSLFWIILVGVSLIAIAYAVRAGTFIQDGYRRGLGLNRLVWQQSETIAHARTIPLTAPIYSNAAEAVYLHTNHAALRLPRKIEQVTGQENPEYESTVRDMQHAFSQQDGFLVYFDFFQPVGYPSAEEMVELFSLKIYAISADGKIYNAGNSP